MKKLIIITACLFLSAVAAQHTFAQTGGAAQSSGPRDLYNTYNKSETATTPATAATTASKPASGRPGVRVRVELDRGGRVRWVSSKTTFQAGDKVRFHFAMNFPGYVVIINEGSSGKRSLLFPYEGVSNHIGRTADYTVPQGEAWFEFDNTAGAEQLTFIMSKREIQEVTQISTAATHAASPAATTTTVNNNSGNGNNSGNNHASAATPHANTSTPDNHSGNDNSNTSASNGQTPAPTAAAAAAPQTEEQEILAALNSRALTGGRDLKMVEDNTDSYVLASDEALAKPIGFKLTLKHR